MKLLFPLLLLLSFNLSAQDSDEFYKQANPEKPKKYQLMVVDDSTKYSYAEIVGTQKAFSRKLTVVLNYGQDIKPFSDQRIKDDEGKVKSFNNMIDALNYMADQGWEFVQAYTITIGQQNVYHWLLKKKKEE